MKTIFRMFLMFVCGLSARAEIRTELVEYKHGDTVLEGYLAYDTAIKGKRPAVLVAHQWAGIEPNEQMRAEMLATMGYVGFAVDIYGKGVRPQNSQDCAAEARKYRNSGPRDLLRARIKAGLDRVRQHPLVDPARVAAIGYCFGGTAVLELARSGADVRGVASFHGALNTPNREDAKKIKCKVLVLHGANDPLVSVAEVANFQEEMRNAKVDWQFISYGGAVHSFTDRRAERFKIAGVAYNERADRRAWEMLKLFLTEVLQ